MNNIKRLEVFGFKSFYNRKELIFPPGLNIIMGPNGSGKSNVAEAICFVFGKSSRKELRAEKMGDLVYNGGKKLPPAKFGKVTVFIDNKNRVFPIEDDEVIISRKVDREGRSLFKVNGNRQPREYVTSLLYQGNINPDGYNIVMQGEISKFIDLSPDERRKIIEELSGISVYEDKKHKCLLEIDKVDARLNEARIILTEKLKHMDELKEQKEQAELFAGLQNNLKLKKASRITKESEELDIVRDGFQKQFDKRESEITAETNKRTALIEKITAKNSELDNLNQELQRRGEVEQVELGQKIEGLRNQVNELKAFIKSENNELIRIEERKKQLNNDLGINNGKLSEIDTKQKELSKKVGEEKNILKEEEDKFEKLNNVDNERVKLLSKINEIENEILKIKGEVANLQKLKDEQEKKTQIETDLRRFKGELDVLLDKNSGISAELGENEEQKRALEKELHQLEGKREAFIRLLDRGVQVIMQLKEKGEIKGVHGIVSELGKTDEKFSMPLKVAAGNRINSIVVDDVEVARKCIEHLKKNELGVATFLPLDKMKLGEKPSKLPDGAVDYAINLVKFNKKYESIFNYLFSDTLIVEDINAAKKIGINRYRMVSLDGVLFEKSGAIHGGFRRKDALIGFKEETFDEQIDEIKSKINTFESKISKLEPEREKSSDEISLLRGRVFDFEEQLKKYEEVDLSKFDILQTEIKKREDDQKKLWEQVKELPKKVAKEVLDKLDARIKKKREELTVLEGQKQGSDLELQIIERDIKRTKELLKGFEKEQISFRQRLNDNEKELKVAEKSLESKLEEEKKFHGKLKELYEKRNNIMDVTKKLEIEKVKIETQIDNMRKQAQEFQLKLAEITAKLEGKKAALEEFKGIDVGKVKERVEELNKQIIEFEAKIAEFGPGVNMMALEKYKEVENEYNSLKERSDKLNSEKEELLHVMDEIESQKNETFIVTFNNVAKNFAKNFGILSPNGSGQLVLENQENPLSGGVDIIARPGGKKMVSLRSMSGGEKTLTTLAFIFAVQEYNPSPFYIMDEVDAALDKENSERLGILLTEYSKKSQFIVITHNDSITAQADNVYGVHMNELGESHIIGIKLPEK